MYLSGTQSLPYASPRTRLPLRIALPLLIVAQSMCTPTLVYGATPATRIIANGVPIEIVFVTDESELPTNPDLDTDDFNQPIPSMKGASCSSLDGPNCLSMLYDSVDLLGDGAPEFAFTSEELMQLIQDNLADLGLDGGLDLDLDFEFGGDANDYEGYLSNEELLGAGVVEFFSGYSKVYGRRTEPGKPSPIPEEHATDMATYAEEVGLSEDFVPQFEFFWSNLESDDYEYQVFVLDAKGLSGTKVAEQLEAYLDGSIQAADVSFDLSTFIVDFDGIKALELEVYPSYIRRLYVQPQRFLEELAESFRENPPSDDDDYVYAEFEVGDLSDVYGVIEGEDGLELVVGEDGLELVIDDDLLTLLEDEDPMHSNTNTISSSSSSSSSDSGSGRRRRKDSSNNGENQDNSQSRTNTDSTSSSSSPPSISTPHDASTQREGRPIKPKGS